MLTELLRPAGPELARRWLAALMLAPESDREAIVEQVEAKIATMYDENADNAAEPAEASELMLHIASEPVRKDDRIEQTIRTYTRAARGENEREAEERRDAS